MKIRVRKSSIKRVRMCGFRKRMRTKGGRAIIKRRRAKGQKLNT
ncbi:MAG: 50S ribosomal protein L34 [Candidatus Scalindua sp.]|nr:50S ribosomal protein L34 [Candidatus Scalindua sp.]MDV5121840.1 50S ribosomal protein L34 [Candidatus Scalindua sp.]HJO48716.1 50S ribosomal protein L34 [Candidatus Scalindua sp.]